MLPLYEKVAWKVGDKLFWRLFKKKGSADNMNNKLEVIGIDHGWSMMKTVSQVFVTGVKEITTTPALYGDVLEYEGRFYKIGTARQEVKDTKVLDDSFYLLTLAAVAKELKRRGLNEAKVFLAVGLPLTRFGAERNDFIKYLTKNKRVDFKYENESYHIEIDDLKSALPVKEDGSYDFGNAQPVVIGADGATSIFSDEKGHAVSIPIPYGTYVVIESVTPHNMTPIKPFEVKITENHPDKPQTWRVFLDRRYSYLYYFGL